MHSFWKQFVWLGEAFKSPQRGDRLISRSHDLIKDQAFPAKQAKKRARSKNRSAEDRQGTAKRWD
jgi:hypothetical protein